MTTKAEELAQQADDVFRDKLLGRRGIACFCGAYGCAAGQCLADGICAAHSTPVAAQMTPDDKARLAKRIGL